MDFANFNAFYRGKRVLVTGHTGFKGSWLCRMLALAGAKVTGYALAAPTDPSLFAIAGIAGHVDSVIGDIRDREHLAAVFEAAQPEVVFHLAAQPIVRDSYKNPVYTYETNVMGTVNVLECVRLNPCVRSFLNVTTDKVYENKEWEYGYRECDPLDGYDPYSNSKSCSELVTHSYRKSFFSEGNCAISTARAGNVIGGGDFASDRIVPDCVRAVAAGQPIVVRNPYSTRPFQHVLEPLYVYLLIAKRQYEDIGFQGYYNVGPDDCDCVAAGKLTDIFCRLWGDGASWVAQAGGERYPKPGADKGDAAHSEIRPGEGDAAHSEIRPGEGDAAHSEIRPGEGDAAHSEISPCKGGFLHEANFLKLDCSKIKRVFGWAPRYHVEEAVRLTVEWSKGYLDGEDMLQVMDAQIKQFFGGMSHV